MKEDQDGVPVFPYPRACRDARVLAMLKRQEVQPPQEGENHNRPTYDLTGIEGAGQ